MKKKILLIILTLFTNIIEAQTNYTNGFNAGYKKGYCQDQGIGCIAPPPPISPIPKIGENSDSYNDGYNRGFIMGLNARKTNSTNTTTNRKRYKTSKPKFVDNIIYKAPVNKQIQVLKRLDKQHEANIRHTETLKAKITRLKQGVSDTLIIQGLNELYETLSEYKNYPFLVEYYTKVAFNEIEDYLNEIESYIQDPNSYTENNVSNVYRLKTRVYLRKGPSDNYAKIINIKATKHSKKTIYYSVGGYSSKIKINLEKDNWTKITRIDTDFPVSGWIKTEYILKINKENNVNKLEYVYELMRNKKYKEALNIIDNKKESYNSEVEIYALRGICNYELEKYPDAISDFTICLQNSKKDIPDILFYRAISKTKIGDNYGAITDFNILIKIGEKGKGKLYDLATIYNNKAYSLVKIRDYYNARKSIKIALELNTNIWYIWDTKGEIDYYTKHYPDCIVSMTKAININPNANSYYFRGKAYLQLNEKEKACKDFSRAGELGNKKAYNEISVNCN